jgi:hypothetical protein
MMGTSNPDCYGENTITLPLPVSALLPNNYSTDNNPDSSLSQPNQMNHQMNQMNAVNLINHINQMNQKGGMNVNQLNQLNHLNQMNQNLASLQMAHMANPHQPSNPIASNHSVSNNTLVFNNLNQLAQLLATKGEFDIVINFIISF